MSTKSKKTAGAQKGGTSTPQAPLKPSQVKTKIEARGALASVPPRALEHSLILAGNGHIHVEVVSAELPSGQLTAPADGGVNAHVLNMSIQGAAVGVHAFPPSPEVIKLSSRRKLQVAEPGSQILQGYAPSHLPLRPEPERLARELAVPPRIQAHRKKGGKAINEATTVFAPDQRFTFSDTAFPWSAMGRVETPGGTASGAMIGPRHLLTVSHAMQWKSDGTVGWVKFSPSYFDGSEPFGVAWAERVYYEVQVVGPGIDNEEGRHDYVVIVLNSRMGDTTGWLGSRTYSDSWDGSSFWSHVGYPGDLASGQRPSYQSSIALDGSDTDPEEHQNILHQGDVWPGQSGGPFFAWWDGETWPSVVSVQSWQNPSNNGASGGGHMVDLIIRARNEFP